MKALYSILKIPNCMQCKTINCLEKKIIPCAGALRFKKILFSLNRIFKGTQALTALKISPSSSLFVQPLVLSSKF